MTNININSKNNTIELTKAVTKKASQFGTIEYDNLQAVRRDYPTYTVVVRSTSRRAKKSLNDYLKGIKLNQIETFVTKHDPEGKRVNEFNRIMGRTEDSIVSYTYPEIKKWFIEAFKKELTEMIMMNQANDNSEDAA